MQKGKRHGTNRLGHLAARTKVMRLAAFVAISMFLTGCLGRRASSVTERDIEVAKDMGAPEKVISAMERGEWLYESDKDAVRYAERAIDHMQKEYGQTCHAQRTTLSWILDPVPKVTLVVDGGEYDGETVTVLVQSECTDNWEAIVRAPEFDQTVSSALEDALSNYPAQSWAASYWADRGVTPSYILSGSVDIYVSRTVIEDEVSLAQVCAAIEEALDATDAQVHYSLLVPTNEPPDHQMTVEFGMEASFGGSKTILYETYGNVGYEDN